MTTLASSSRVFLAQARQGRRFMSANAKVWIDKDTRVICQGFTGKQVRPPGDSRTISTAVYTLLLTHIVL